MINLKTTTLFFLFAAIPITLFPPFNWGEERLQTESERHYTIRWGTDFKSYQNILPLKKRAFLFGETKQQFKIKQPDSEAETEIALDRKLIVGDLILEYVFAVLLAVLAGWLTIKRLNKITE